MMKQPKHRATHTGQPGCLGGNCARVAQGHAVSCMLLRLAVGNNLLKFAGAGGSSGRLR